MSKSTKCVKGKAMKEDRDNDAFIQGAQSVEGETVKDGTEVNAPLHDDVKDEADSEGKRDGEDPGNSPVLADEAPYINEGASNTKGATATPKESRYWLRPRSNSVSLPDNPRIEKYKYWLRPRICSTSSFMSTGSTPNPQRGFERLKNCPEIMTVKDEFFPQKNYYHSQLTVDEEKSEDIFQNRVDQLAGIEENNEVLIKAHQEDEDHRGASVVIHNHNIKLERTKKGVDDSEKGVKESMAEAPSTYNQHTFGIGDKGVFIEKEDDEHLPSDDLFALLPKEVLIYLFDFLKPGDLLSVSQTSMRWRILAEDDLMWKRRCERAGLANCLTPRNLEDLERRNENGKFSYSRWKASFLKPYRIERNFRLKDPQVIRVEKGFKASRDPMKLLNNKIVFHSGRSLYVSCALSGKWLFMLVGHTGMIRAIEMDKRVVISGSDDRTLKVWNVDTGECLHTLVGHTGPVLCLQLHGGLVVSGSEDTTLRVWDVQEGRSLHTLVGHQTPVNRLQYDGRLVVSGDSSSLKVWDPSTGDCLRTLIALVQVEVPGADFLTELKFDGAHVVTVFMYNLVMVWDVETGIRKCTKFVHDHGISNMELRNDVLVCRYHNDMTDVTIAECDTGTLLHTLDGQHIGAVTGIQVNEKFVVTSSTDGTVKLWDVKTGEYVKNLFSGDEDWKWKVCHIEMEDAKIVCLCVSDRWIHEMDKTKLLVLNLDFDEE